MSAQAKHQVAKFLLTGGASTGLQYVLLIAFIEWGKISETLSSAMAFTLSALFNYVSNYYFTFKDNNKPHNETGYKFAITACLGLLMNTTIFWLGAKLLPHYILAQCVATGITVIFNFLLHKHWIYANETHHEHS